MIRVLQSIRGPSFGPVALFAAIGLSSVATNAGASNDALSVVFPTGVRTHKWIVVNYTPLNLGLGGTEALLGSRIRLGGESWLRDSVLYHAPVFHPAISEVPSELSHFYLLRDTMMYITLHGRGSNHERSDSPFQYRQGLEYTSVAGSQFAGPTGLSIRPSFWIKAAKQRKMFFAPVKPQRYLVTARIFLFGSNSGVVTTEFVAPGYHLGIRKYDDVCLESGRLAYVRKDQRWELIPASHLSPPQYKSIAQKGLRTGVSLIQTVTADYTPEGFINVVTSGP